jgi:thiosulfate/3-mercaptopyruvate sulfurtransferase
LVPHKTLISTATLADLHANAGEHPEHSEALAIIDCRYDLGDDTWGVNAYRAAHIPGAVYASLSRELSGPLTGRNGRHPLPSLDAMVGTFSRMGIGPGTQVVAYDQDNGMYASRLWWMLRYLGHDRVAVLDGGWAKWTREEKPTRPGDEMRRPVDFRAQVRDACMVDVGELEEIVDRRSALLVDARGTERYEGQSEPIDRVAGHIPGAVNHPYKSNVTEAGTMLPPAALRAAFDTLLAGRAPDEVIAYCGSGVTACHNLLAMELVGLSGAKLYPGSWSEWSADPQRPVETGPAKKG